MDFMRGGEVFFHLRRERRFSEDRARFYVAEILLAMDYMHQSGIIYRDLKPENVLLDEEGHICLSDFGLSKVGLSEGERTLTFCGTPQYLAPEIIKREGHDKAVDYWSLGAMLFNMLSGSTPFQQKNRDQLYVAICSEPVELRPYFSDEACDLLDRLMTIDP